MTKNRRRAKAEAADLRWQADELTEAVVYGRPDDVAALIGRGVDVNARNERGYAALDEAALGGDLDNLRLLLTAGADVRSRDAEGRQVLHWAVGSERDSCACVRLLIEGGADVNAKTDGGWSVLYWTLALGMRPGVVLDEDMLRLLIDAGADLDGAMDEARKNNNFRVLAKLEELSLSGPHGDGENPGKKSTPPIL